MRRDRMLGWLAGIALLATTLPALGGSVDWGSLDPGTQTLLSPWQGAWNTLADDDRQRLLANAHRWQSMSAADRTALLQRQTQWDALPPAERAHLRARNAAWRQLPASEQAQISNAATRFDALPTTQQAALRARFAAQPAEWQASWLLGPSIGAWLDQAGTWFAYVPASDRDATLRMLQDLTPDARAQLFEVSRRLPSPQRERLREDLLNTPQAQRAALIARRLE
ncbi:MAG: DUF3106 domain-containing protein [Proteobacteria bacterium]|nr:DUF3106 domain-containing protein [Pseudomonadota bacterium]